MVPLLAAASASRFPRVKREAGSHGAPEFGHVSPRWGPQNHSAGRPATTAAGPDRRRESGGQRGGRLGPGVADAPGTEARGPGRSDAAAARPGRKPPPLVGCGSLAAASRRPRPRGSGCAPGRGHLTPSPARGSAARGSRFAVGSRRRACGRPRLQAASRPSRASRPSPRRPRFQAVSAAGSAGLGPGTGGAGWEAEREPRAPAGAGPRTPSPGEGWAPRGWKRPFRTDPSLRHRGARSGLVSPGSSPEGGPGRVETQGRARKPSERRSPPTFPHALHVFSFPNQGSFCVDTVGGRPQVCGATGGQERGGHLSHLLSLSPFTLRGHSHIARSPGLHGSLSHEVTSPEEGGGRAECSRASWVPGAH